MSFDGIRVGEELIQMIVSKAGICAALAILESFISDPSGDVFRTLPTHIGYVRGMKIESGRYRFWFSVVNEDWMMMPSVLLTLDEARSLKQIVTSDDFPAAEKEGEKTVFVEIDVCD